MEPPSNPLDRYTERTVIGSGVTGQAVRAFDKQANRWVVIKSALPETDAKEDLRREARALRQLAEAKVGTRGVGGVCELVDADVEVTTQIPYIVLECLDRLESPYVPAPKFREVLGRALTSFELLRIWFELAKLLEVAHDLGFIHRDLNKKPEHVWVRWPRKLEEESGPSIKVIDWGNAAWPTGPRGYVQDLEGSARVAYELWTGYLYQSGEAAEPQEISAARERQLWNRIVKWCEAATISEEIRAKDLIQDIDGLWQEACRELEGHVSATEANLGNNTAFRTSKQAAADLDPTDPRLEILQTAQGIVVVIRTLRDQLEHGFARLNGEGQHSSTSDSDVAAYFNEAQEIAQRLRRYLTDYQAMLPADCQAMPSVERLFAYATGGMVSSGELLVADQGNEAMVYDVLARAEAGLEAFGLGPRLRGDWVAAVRALSVKGFEEALALMLVGSAPTEHLENLEIPSTSLQQARANTSGVALLNAVWNALGRIDIRGATERLAEESLRSGDQSFRDKAGLLKSSLANLPQRPISANALCERYAELAGNLAACSASGTTSERLTQQLADAQAEATSAAAGLAAGKLYQEAQHLRRLATLDPAIGPWIRERWQIYGPAAQALSTLEDAAAGLRSYVPHDRDDTVEGSEELLAPVRWAVDRLQFPGCAWAQRLTEWFRLFDQIWDDLALRRKQREVPPGLMGLRWAMASLLSLSRIHLAALRQPTESDARAVQTFVELANDYVGSGESGGRGFDDATLPGVYSDDGKPELAALVAGLEGVPGRRELVMAVLDALCYQARELARKGDWSVACRVPAIIRHWEREFQRTNEPFEESGCRACTDEWAGIRGFSLSVVTILDRIEHAKVACGEQDFSRTSALLGEALGVENGVGTLPSEGRLAHKACSDLVDAVASACTALETDEGLTARSPQEVVCSAAGKACELAGRLRLWAGGVQRMGDLTSLADTWSLIGTGTLPDSCVLHDVDRAAVDWLKRRDLGIGTPAGTSIGQNGQRAVPDEPWTSLVIFASPLIVLAALFLPLGGANAIANVRSDPLGASGLLFALVVLMLIALGVLYSLLFVRLPKLISRMAQVSLRTYGIVGRAILALLVASLSLIVVHLAGAADSGQLKPQEQALTGAANIDSPTPEARPREEADDEPGSGTSRPGGTQGNPLATASSSWSEGLKLSSRGPARQLSELTTPMVLSPALGEWDLVLLSNGQLAGAGSTKTAIVWALFEGDRPLSEWGTFGLAVTFQSVDFYYYLFQIDPRERKALIQTHSRSPGDRERLSGWTTGLIPQSQANFPQALLEEQRMLIRLTLGRGPDGTRATVALGGSPQDVSQVLDFSWGQSYYVEPEQLGMFSVGSSLTPFALTALSIE